MFKSSSASGLDIHELTCLRAVASSWPNVAAVSSRALCEKAFEVFRESGKE
jgi:hypothetical protein